MYTREEFGTRIWYNLLAFIALIPPEAIYNFFACPVGIYLGLIPDFRVENVM